MEGFCVFQRLFSEPQGAWGAELRYFEVMILHFRKIPLPAVVPGGSGEILRKPLAPSWWRRRTWAKAVGAGKRGH